MNRIHQLLENVQVLTVIGAQWGDEGKGKIIDALADEFDIIARFSGGRNAGHTVFTLDGKKLVSHIIPCGLARHKTCVIGPGVLFDLEGFIHEYDDAKVILEGQLAPVYIDRMCPLWTPWHGMYERWLESCRGGKVINTTGKGIGPLAGFSALRIGPIVSDLFGNPQVLRERLQALYQSILPNLEAWITDMKENKYPESTTPSIPTPNDVIDYLHQSAPRIEGMVQDTSYILYQAHKDGKRILAEGAQSVGLDRTFGTYPYVSAGNSTNHGAPLGLGLPPHWFTHTLWLLKYFPHEWELALFRQKCGTGRQRKTFRVFIPNYSI